MKKILRRVILVIALIAGSSILISGMFWESLFLSGVYSMAPSSSDEQDLSSIGGEDEVIMEGRMGFMSLIWDSMEGNGLQGEYPAVEDFDIEQRDVYVTSEGIFHRDSDERISDTPQQQTDEGDTFPTGGVKKKNYEIYNAALNASVTVRYTGETKILGRTGYIYSSNIVDAELKNGMDSFQDQELDPEISEIMEDMDVFYTDTSDYVLDPRTSIPYDIRLDLSSSVIFPDFTLLTVLEEQVRYSEETIWIPSSSSVNRMEEKNVIVEKKTTGGIDPENELIGLYTLETTYYDRETGEPLDEELQGGSESFAVDRTTYQYILGYKGTRRSGFYQFPVGNAMKRDYPMWDESIEAENIAEFTGESEIDGTPVFIYTMVTEDVVVEGGNALLPIYLHPGTTYTLDTVQQWFIDEETGFMLDFRIEGTIIVSSSGPLGLVEQSVGAFMVDLPENTTDELKEVSILFRDFLIPMSDKRVEVFSLDIYFSEGLQERLVEVADQVSFIIDMVENKVPRILMTAGAVVLLVVLVLFFAAKRRKKNRQKQNVYVAIIE